MTSEASSLSVIARCRTCNRPKHDGPCPNYAAGLEGEVERLRAKWQEQRGAEMVALATTDEGDRVSERRWTLHAVNEDNRRTANAMVEGPMIGPGDEAVEVVPADQLAGAVSEIEDAIRQLESVVTRGRKSADDLLEARIMLRTLVSRLQGGQ